MRLPEPRVLQKLPDNQLIVRHQYVRCTREERDGTLLTERRLQPANSQEPQTSVIAAGISMTFRDNRATASFQDIGMSLAVELQFLLTVEQKRVEWSTGQDSRTPWARRGWGRE
jgi:hypothetical protein